MDYSNHSDSRGCWAERVSVALATRFQENYPFLSHLINHSERGKKKKKKPVKSIMMQFNIFKPCNTSQYVTYVYHCRSDKVWHPNLSSVLTTMPLLPVMIAVS